MKNPSSLRNQDGNVTLLTAGFALLAMTVLALVFDVGTLYNQRRDAQTAADSGALAGAVEMAMGGDWYTEADEHVTTNWDANVRIRRGSGPALERHIVSLADGPCPVSPPADPRDWPSDSRGVHVHLVENSIPLFFAPLIGAWGPEARVGAKATARIVPLAEAEDLFPVFAPYYVESLRAVLSGGSVGRFEIPLSRSMSLRGSEPYALFSANFPANFPAGVYNLSLESYDPQPPHGVYARWTNVGRLNILSNPSESAYLESLDADAVSGGTLILSTLGAPPEVKLSTSNQALALTLLGTDESGRSRYRATIPLNRLENNKDYEPVTVSLAGTVVAAYPRFHSEDGVYDVPLRRMSVTPAVGVGGNVEIAVEAVAFDYRYVFPLKIDSNIRIFGGGERRSGDIFLTDPKFADPDPGLDEEIQGEFNAKSAQWIPRYRPLVVGQKLEADTGQAGGQAVINGWNKRLEAAAPGWSGNTLTQPYLTSTDSPQIEPGDPHFVVVPLIHFRNDHGDNPVTYWAPLLKKSLTLQSRQYRIATFVGYYIFTDPPPSDPTFRGVFVRAFDQGRWDPDYQPRPGDVFVETVVLTD